MTLKNIWKITLLLSWGRCQYVQGRIDERIFEALKKRKQIRLQGSWHNKEEKTPNYKTCLSPIAIVLVANSSQLVWPDLFWSKSAILLIEEETATNTTSC